MLIGFMKLSVDVISSWTHKRNDIWFLMCWKVALILTQKRFHKSNDTMNIIEKEEQLWLAKIESVNKITNCLCSKGKFVSIRLTCTLCDALKEGHWNRSVLRSYGPQWNTHICKVFRFDFVKANGMMRFCWLKRLIKVEFMPRSETVCTHNSIFIEVLRIVLISLFETFALVFYDFIELFLTEK